MSLKDIYQKIVDSFRYVREHNIDQELADRKINLPTFNHLNRIVKLIQLFHFIEHFIVFYLICYGIMLNYIFYVFYNIDMSCKNVIAFGLLWYFIAEEITTRIGKIRAR